MLHSILLYFDGAHSAAASIDVGVGLARRHQARLRGLSVTDTRWIESLASCETAAYAGNEQARLERGEQQQGAARSDLSQACLLADLNFDVRRLRGNPLELLPREARFHDLTIVANDDGTPARPEAALRPKELVDLVFLGLQPLLVVRRQPQPLARVLLVHDGTPASGRAIRSFISQGIAIDAEYRCLTFGGDETQARETSRELVDYCRQRHLSLETGWMAGSARKALANYARKWQADVIVLGATRGNRLTDWLFGDAAEIVLNQLSCALYVTT